jgi:hypothetical protein
MFVETADISTARRGSFVAAHQSERRISAERTRV